MLTSLRHEARAICVIEESCEVGVSTHYHIATAAAVTAVGPTFGNSVFATEGAGTRATRPCLYLYPNTIDE